MPGIKTELFLLRNRLFLKTTSLFFCELNIGGNLSSIYYLLLPLFLSKNIWYFLPTYTGPKPLQTYSEGTEHKFGVWHHISVQRTHTYHCKGRELTRFHVLMHEECNSP